MFKLIISETINDQTASQIFTFSSLAAMLKAYNELYINWLLERQPPTTQRRIKMGNR